MMGLSDVVYVEKRRGTEERIKCSEEITHVWSAVDLVVEMFSVRTFIL